MQTSNTWARRFSLKFGKIVITLIFASIIGGIPTTPAFSQNYHDRQGRYHRDDRHNRHHERRQHRPHHGYNESRVYAPPPVVYDPVPYQSPGINLIFPIRIR